MNIQHTTIALLGLVSVMTATGCTSGKDPGTADSSVKTDLSAWSAPCNLGVEREGSGSGWTAIYDLPTLAEQTDLDLYGEPLPTTHALTPRSFGGRTCGTVRPERRYMPCDLES